MPLWLFIFLAVIAICGAFGVILQRSPLHCVLALALTLVDIGALFVGLGAATLGFLQIVVYVGAVMMLFLFVIWLLNLQAEPPPPNSHLALKFFGSIGAAALAAELSLFFWRADPVSRVTTIPADYGSVERLAQLLFSDYLVAFEVTSVLLLAAVAGAMALARRLPGGSIAPTVPGKQSATRAGSTAR
jgi:NADH-quinone oxidoreductase subunit J